MFELITALTGASFAILGIFLFFSHRLSKPTTRPYRGSDVISLLLMITGGVLLLSSVTINSANTEIAESFDPNRLMDKNPSAAGIPASVRDNSTNDRMPPDSMLPYKKITVLAWGTPDDEDTANSAQISKYSKQLRQTLNELLSRYTIHSAIESAEFTRSDYAALLALPLTMQNWCDDEKSDFIVAVGIGPNRLDDDFALWREPIFEAIDCSTDQGLRRSGRIVERPGDQFPYQRAIQANVSKLLEDFRPLNRDKPESPR